MLELSSIIEGMNQLSNAARVQIIAALVEGNSINSVCRMMGRSKHTVLKLLADLGAACTAYHEKHVRNIVSKRDQCDEIWSFCYAKQKNLPADKLGQFGYGDVWTWVAMDGGLLASRMDSQRRSKTRCTPWRSILCTTISAASTQACASLRRWKPELLIMFGRLKI